MIQQSKSNRNITSNENKMSIQIKFQRNIFSTINKDSWQGCLSIMRYQI